MKMIFMLIAAILLASCASMANREHARTLKLAAQDDQSCQVQGWHYPDARYITCRLQISDQRQYKDWMSLQMMHQSQYQNLSAPPPYPYRDIYRPLDPDHYQCQYLKTNDQDYVLCRDQTKT